METAYLLPLTVICLVLALAALAFRANRRRGYGPFVVGVLAAALLMVGKFVLDSNVAVYGAIGSLIGASLWNSWPISTTSVPFAPTDTLLQIRSKRSDEHGYQTQD
jgi:hypothetical protein